MHFSLLGGGPMTPFDYTVLAVVGISVLVSLFRGALREVMSILSWIQLAAIRLPDPTAW